MSSGGNELTPEQLEMLEQLGLSADAPEDVELVTGYSKTVAEQQFQILEEYAAIEENVNKTIGWLQQVRDGKIPE